MSPEAQLLLDEILDLLAGKLDARDWCDVGHAIYVAGLANLDEERRSRVQAATPQSTTRALAIFGASEHGSEKLRLLN